MRNAFLLVVPLVILSACSTMESRRIEDDPRRHTVTVRQDLDLFDSLIPVSPDSVLELYAKLDTTTFRSTYDSLLRYVCSLIDSLNGRLASGPRIDTLAIDHSVENFGDAALQRSTLHISSSYFFLFRDASILRSVIWHEYGHLYHERLPARARDSLALLWNAVKSAALFYLFHDGEYSGNARFGGHPQEGPSELFASAFNLLQNRQEEFGMRLKFIDPKHLSLVELIQRIVAYSLTLQK